MKRKPLLALAVLCTAAGLLLHGRLAPRGENYTPPPIPATAHWALLPIDNRPPCRDFTVELGALAGISVTAPPDNIMDWYEKPANIPALKTWLEAQLPQQQGAIIPRTCSCSAVFSTPGFTR